MPATPSPAARNGSDDEALARDVRDRLAQVLARRRTELAAISPESAALVDVLEDHLVGGKLLRPRFCWWGGASVREPDAVERGALVDLGAAIELVQAAALIHDDVIDHSPTRRGRPAVHVQAAADHRDADLSGDAADHGRAVAIVLGDLALSWAWRLAVSAASAVPDGSGALEEFDHLCTEVMAGQHLDILHQAGGLVSLPDPEEAARAVIRWKTVPYTVLRPLRMGAALLGASAVHLAHLSAYGEVVGAAFQLRDDLLGATGDEARTGKSGSGDLTEGKRTVLLARAQSAADEDSRAVLAQVIGDESADEADIDRVRGVLARTGALEAVAAEIREAAPRAVRILQDAPMPPAAREHLARLAQAATDLEGIGVGLAGSALESSALESPALRSPTVRSPEPAPGA